MSSWKKKPMSQVDTPGSPELNLFIIYYNMNIITLNPELTNYFNHKMSYLKSAEWQDEFWALVPP